MGVVTKGAWSKFLHMLQTCPGFLIPSHKMNHESSHLDHTSWDITHVADGIKVGGSAGLSSQ